MNEKEFHRHLINVFIVSIVASFFLFLLGCISQSDKMVEIDPTTVKFKAGDKVSIVAPHFYQNCSGVIENHATYKYGSKPLNYQVSLYCPEIGWLKNSEWLSESNLETTP